MTGLVTFQPWAVVGMAAVWLVGVCWSRPILRRAGVRRPGSALALSAVVPTAALMIAVQILGALSLFEQVRIVRPWWILATFAVLVVALVMLARTVVPFKGDDTPTCVPTQPRRWSRTWFVPVLILAGTHFVFLVDALSRFPTGYDSVHYHLPAAVLWVQDGALTLPPFSPHMAQAAGGDVPAMILLAGGFERLLPIISVPQGLLAALVLFEIAALLGVGVVGRWMAAGLMLSTPVVIYQMYSNYVDLFAASFWLAGLLAILSATRVDRAKHMCLLMGVAGLAAGIAAGTRTTYWVLAVVLGCGVLLVAWRLRRTECGLLDRLTVSGLTFGACCVAGMWFWPLRAYLVTGQPLYPLAYADGEWTHGGTPLNEIFASSGSVASLPIVERVWKLMVLPWREFKFGSGYGYGVEDGTGATYAMIVPLGLLLAIGTLLSRRKRGDTAFRRWMIVGVIGVGLLLHLTQFKMYTRYSLATILLAIPVGVMGVEWLLQSRPRSMAYAASIGLCVSGAIAGLQPARDLAGRLRDGNWHRPAFYLTPDLFDVIAPGSVVLNTESESETMTYALSGEALSNRVIDPVQWRRMLAVHAPDANALPPSVDYVYVRGDGNAMPAAQSTAYTLRLVYDDSHAPLSPGGPITRVYHVIRKVPVSKPDLRSARLANGR